VTRDGARLAAALALALLLGAAGRADAQEDSISPLFVVDQERIEALEALDRRAPRWYRPRPAWAGRCGVHFGHTSLRSRPSPEEDHIGPRDSSDPSA